MSLDSDKTQPLREWLLCRALKPNWASGKLYIPEAAAESSVVSEGVAEVLRIGEGVFAEELGEYVPHGVEPGDKVLYRGFLRFAQQVGDLYGEHNNSDIFLLNVKDVLATVEGPGRVGMHGEYEL